MLNGYEHFFGCAGNLKMAAPNLPKRREKVSSQSPEEPIEVERPTKSDLPVPGATNPALEVNKALVECLLTG